MTERRPAILAIGIKIVESHDERSIAQVDQTDDVAGIRNSLDQTNELNIIDGLFGPL